MPKQKKLLKQFSNWLNKKDRQNWEIERYVEGLLKEKFKEFKELEKGLEELRRKQEELEMFFLNSILCLPKKKNKK